MLRRVVGNGLRVIAGRGGDQSALLFLGSQRQDAVERPSFLVGSGSLQVFKFQKDGIPRLRRKCLRAPAGRDKNRVPNPLARLAYLFEGHHENPSYYTSTSGGDARNTTFLSLSMESVAARPECGALRATTRLLRREEIARYALSSVPCPLSMLTWMFGGFVACIPAVRSLAAELSEGPWMYSTEPPSGKSAAICRPWIRPISLWSELRENMGVFEDLRSSAMYSASRFKTAQPIPAPAAARATWGRAVPPTGSKMIASGRELPPD